MYSQVSNYYIYYYYAICRIAPNFHAQILYDFRELHRNHEIFCHKNFLSAALSTRLDTLASRNDKYHDIQTTEIWSCTVK